MSERTSQNIIIISLFFIPALGFHSIIEQHVYATPRRRGILLCALQQLKVFFHFRRELRRNFVYTHVIMNSL